MSSNYTACLLQNSMSVSTLNAVNEKKREQLAAQVSDASRSPSVLKLLISHPLVKRLMRPISDAEL